LLHCFPSSTKKARQFKKGSHKVVPFFMFFEDFGY
jgi:hypothetical protein